MATVETTNTPVFTTRHRRLETCVWENHGDNGRSFFNTTLRRSYKNGDDWSSTSASLNRDDLLPAAKLLEWADEAVGIAIRDNTKSDGSKPVTAKKRGLLEAVVFKKAGEDGTYFRVGLKRSFNDGEDWKEFRVWLDARDCLPAARLLVRTFDAIDGMISESSTNASQASTANVDGDEDIPF